MRLLVLLVLVVVAGCGTETIVDPPPEAMTVYPTRALLAIGETQQFVVDPSSGDSLVWTVSSGPGTISASGEYTAPASIAGDTVIATIAASRPRARSTAVITIAIAPDRICYERDVRPILTTSCALAGCHDPASRQHGYDFTHDRSAQRAVVPGEPALSAMYQMITHPLEHRRMPPTPRERLSAEHIETIRRWIFEGAQVRPCEVGGQPCDSLGVGFASTIQPILARSCTGCHGTATAANGMIDLSNHSGVRSPAASGQLLGSILHLPGYAPMPSSTMQLDDCEIAQIRQWIIAGAPNN